jgi:hypothetical protein
VTRHSMPAGVAVRCVMADCVVCRAAVHTCELAECPDGFLHFDGGQLSSGGWVCSERCWERATAWPRPMDRALGAARAMLALAIFVGAFVFYRQTPLPTIIALPLALILAGLFVAVLHLVEAAPSKGPGRVVSRGRR